MTYVQVWIPFGHDIFFIFNGHFMCSINHGF